MKRLLFILLFISTTHSAYIDTAVVACQTLKSIKYIEPHIHKDSNQFHIPKDCLILTHNADIQITQIIENDYIEIIVKDLNLKMYTLKSLLSDI